MNETRVEKFNALVRGAVTLMFAGAYAYMCIRGHISGEAFTATISSVLTWWFVSRDRKSELDDAKKGNGNGAASSNGIAP